MRGRRIEEFSSWLIAVLCLLALLCPVTLRRARAQTDRHTVNRQTAEQIPGVPAGYTIIDGDIQMPISVVNSLRNKSSVEPQAAFFGDLWPNGVVRFQFQTTCLSPPLSCPAKPATGCVSEEKQVLMRKAMDVVEQVSNVRFQRCPDDDCGLGPFITIRDSTNDSNVNCDDLSRNSSPLGMRLPGPQIINITDWERESGRFIMVHELMHSLGFFHEHQRAVRDTYVDIICKNIKGGCFTLGDVDLPVGDFALGSPTKYGYYDFDSVMHYGRCAFSKNPGCPEISDKFPDGGITIRVKEPYAQEKSPEGKSWQEAIGQRKRLSFLDRTSLSFLYPPNDWRFFDCNFGGVGLGGKGFGTFLIPHNNFADAVADTPAGGTLWILTDCNIKAAGTYSKPVTIRAAPFVTAKLGG